MEGVSVLSDSVACGIVADREGSVASLLDEGEPKTFERTADPDAGRAQGIDMSQSSRSQPLAFAASALVTISLGGGDGLPLVVWGFVTIITLAVALAFEPKRMSRLLRLTSAIAILATVAVHLLRHGGLYADQAGWGMGAALVMVRLILLASLRKGRMASERD